MSKKRRVMSVGDTTLTALITKVLSEPSDGEIYQATSIANTPDKVNKEIDDIIEQVAKQDRKNK